MNITDVADEEGVDKDADALYDPSNSYAEEGEEDVEDRLVWAYEDMALGEGYWYGFYKEDDRGTS